MQDQPNENDKLEDVQRQGFAPHALEIEAILSAVIPQVDDYFRADLEEQLVSKLNTRQASHTTLPTKHRPGSNSSRRALMSEPVLQTPLPRTNAFRRGISRAASFAIGVTGIILLGALFTLMSAMLGGRQSLPRTQPEQPKSGPYTAVTSEGSLHIAVVAGNNVQEAKPGTFLFFYAMRSSQKGLPIVTGQWKFATPRPKISYPTPIPTKDKSGATRVSTPSPTAPILPTVVPNETLKVTDIQSLGQLGEFQVGVIYAEWENAPVGSTFTLLVTPPGGKQASWQVTPFVDFPLDHLSEKTTFFKNSPPEMGQVSVACPCGPQAFRLAILGHSTSDAPPIILGINYEGIVALMTEEEYFNKLSPEGTPFPTEDTEHVQIAPTYPPTSTTVSPNANR